LYKESVHLDLNQTVGSIAAVDWKCRAGIISEPPVSPRRWAV
jgi:hypothetical protein